MKSWLIWKDPDAGKDWGQEKGTTENEVVGWHHRLDGCEFEEAPGVAEGQGSLVCCSPWVAMSWIRLGSWTTTWGPCIWGTSVCVCLKWCERIRANRHLKAIRHQEFSQEICPSIPFTLKSFGLEVRFFFIGQVPLFLALSFFSYMPYSCPPKMITHTSNTVFLTDHMCRPYSVAPWPYPGFQMFNKGGDSRSETLWPR